MTSFTFNTEKSSLLLILSGLDLLSRNLPRTFVVLLAPIDVTVVQSFTDKPVLCGLTHKYECPCLFQQNNGVRGTKRVKWLHSQYKKILKRLSYEEKYNRDDFTVEYLSTLVDDIPRVRTAGGRHILDIDTLSSDCFHFRKELHSRMGV